MRAKTSSHEKKDLSGNEKINSIRLQNLPHLSATLDVDIRVVRDDCLPLFFGGNKSRKMSHIVNDILQIGCNALVTTGGIQSNHARVVALLAAQRGWRCKLVLHGPQAALKKPCGNALLMCLAGAEVVVVDQEHIAAEMEKAMQDFYRDGLVPYEIPGGGHSLKGAMAYVEAIRELEEQCRKDQWQPELIILASGTGATQAGIIIGLQQVGWGSRVLGISVARKNPRGSNIVAQSCEELRVHLNLQNDSHHAVDFRDNWVGEGYEKARHDVFDVIRMAAKLEGLILDPTYTGKAFRALVDLIRSGDIEKGTRVLFWHTGGLMNLIASPYTEDILQL